VRGEQLSPRGYSALTAGGWVDARAAFERALAEQESPHAPFGLAMVLWWLELRNSSSIRRMSWYTVLPRRFTPNGWSTRLKENRVGEWLQVANTISTGRAISISPSMRRLTGHPSCAPTDSIAMRRL
jgi:hypothetical protein